MSSLLELLQEKIGAEGISEISRRLGTDKQSTETAIGAALPALIGAVSKQGSDASGVQGLLGILDRNGDGNILDDLPGFLAGASAKPSAGGGAAELLGSLLGGSQTRVESGIQKASGLNSQATGKLLAMLAPIVMGAVLKTKQSRGLDAGGLQDFLGNEKASVEKKTGGLISRLLDQDGDGDFDLSDIAKLAMGKLFGRR